MFGKQTIPHHVWPEVVVTHIGRDIRDVSLPFVMSHWADLKPVEETKDVCSAGAQGCIIANIVQSLRAYNGMLNV